MNNSTEFVKGQIVCRPTSWTDVITFVVFNYGLHALTIVSTPGSRTFTTAVYSAIALLLPFSGVCSALAIVQRFEWSKADEQQTAHNAGALCMVVPTPPGDLDFPMYIVSLAL